MDKIILVYYLALIGMQILKEMTYLLKVENFVALEQDIQETQAEYDALIADMEARINTVQDGDARDLLRKRYLEFLPWSEIMKEMGYSKSHVFRLHSTAVAALKSWDTVGLANTGNV